MAVKPIPEGYRTITPYLVQKDSAKAIEFYKKAFGAQEIMRMPGPDGRGVMHAEIRIGDSILMMSDESPMGGGKSPQTLGDTTAGLHLYFDNVDKAVDRASAAGAKVDMPPADMFWGDRFAKLTDPFGHSWSIATHKEDVAPDEMAKRGQEAFAQMSQKGD